MRLPIWLSFFIFLFPLALIPLLLFGDLLIHGLIKLHISSGTASLLCSACSRRDSSTSRSSGSVGGKG
jgi:hypothetical protein